MLRKLTNTEISVIINAALQIYRLEGGDLISILLSRFGVKLEAFEDKKQIRKED
jgi:hypothetical protein